MPFEHVEERGIYPLLQDNTPWSYFQGLKYHLVLETLKTEEVNYFRHIDKNK